MATSCENGNELPGFRKMQDTSLTDEQILASQMGLLPVESFIYCHLGRMLQVPFVSARCRTDNIVAAQRLIKPLSLQ
jgi:hypothetical protein